MECFYSFVGQIWPMNHDLAVYSLPLYWVFINTFHFCSNKLWSSMMVGFHIFGFGRLFWKLSPGLGPRKKKPRRSVLVASKSYQNLIYSIFWRDVVITARGMVLCYSMFSFTTTGLRTADMIVNLMLGHSSFIMFSNWIMKMEQRTHQHWLIERYV